MDAASLATLLQSPLFWVAYGTMSAVLAGPVWYWIGRTDWLERFDRTHEDEDVTVARIGVTLLVCVLWVVILPVIASYHLAWKGTEAMDRRRKQAGPTPSDSIRCWQCTHAIATSDSFCKLCGADQSKLPEPEETRKAKKSAAKPPSIRMSRL